MFVDIEDSVSEKFRLVSSDSGKDMTLFVEQCIIKIISPVIF